MSMLSLCVHKLRSLWVIPSQQYPLSSKTKVGHQPKTAFKILLTVWDQYYKTFFATTKEANDDGNQCDQKKSPNVYKSCPKMISLEK